jgi:hypothetical protein
MPVRVLLPDAIKIGCFERAEPELSPVEARVLASEE